MCAAREARGGRGKGETDAAARELPWHAKRTHHGGILMRQRGRGTTCCERRKLSLSLSCSAAPSSVPPSPSPSPQKSQASQEGREQQQPRVLRRKDGGQTAAGMDSKEREKLQASIGPSLPSLDDVAKHGEDKFDSLQKNKLAEDYLDVSVLSRSRDNIGSGAACTSGRSESEREDTADDPQFEKDKRRAKRILLDLMTSGEEFESVFLEYCTAGVVDEVLALTMSARLRTAIADGDTDLQELLALLLQRVMHFLANSSASPSMRLLNELLSERYMLDDEASLYTIRKKLGIGEDGSIQFVAGGGIADIRERNKRDVIGIAIDISSRGSSIRESNSSKGSNRTIQPLNGGLSSSQISGSGNSSSVLGRLHKNRSMQNVGTTDNKYDGVATDTDSSHNNNERVAIQDFFESIDGLLTDAERESEQYRETHENTLARLRQIRQWVIDMVT